MKTILNRLMILLIGVVSTSMVCSKEWRYEPLLKSAVSKSMRGQITGIDFLYVINLDQRPEKFAFVLKQFARFGIEPYRFSAVNGWELSHEVMKTLGITLKKKPQKKIKGTYYEWVEEKGLKEKHVLLADATCPCLSHCMSRGAVGIVLSHLSVIKDAYDSGFHRVWIMEDDIEILEDIRDLTALIREADQNMRREWDILYTDIDTKTNSGHQKPAYGMAYRPDLISRYIRKSSLVKRTKLTKNLTLLGNRFGAYSYLINRSGMKKILNYFKKHHMFFPYDMELIYIDGLKQLALTYNLVSTKVNSPSDNGGPNYLNKKRPD